MSFDHLPMCSSLGPSLSLGPSPFHLVVTYIFDSLASMSIYIYFLKKGKCCISKYKCARTNEQ